MFKLDSPESPSLITDLGINELLVLKLFIIYFCTCAPYFKGCFRYSWNPFIDYKPSKLFISAYILLISVLLMNLKGIFDTSHTFNHEDHPVGNGWHFCLYLYLILVILILNDWNLKGTLDTPELSHLMTPLTGNESINYFLLFWLVTFLIFLS